MYEPIKDLPPLLRRRIADDAPETDKAEVFRALVSHYDITAQFDALSLESAGDEKQVLATKFWSDLAIHLIFDFVPAYRLQKRGRRRNNGHLGRDWIAAGGNLITAPWSDPQPFYQAQFVQVVGHREGDARQSRNWVFRWFANEVSRVQPSEAVKRRALLPRPFRNRATAASLRQAFNSIPKAIRTNPTKFLPQVGASSEFLSDTGLPKGGLF